MTKTGYIVKVWSQNEKDAKDSEELQILNAVMANMPGNQKLIEIYQRKLLEFAKLQPDEVNDIIEAEKNKIPTQLPMGTVTQPTQPAQITQPTTPQQTLLS
jgi:hypothetical protein